ncbi:MAG: hypothetical protein R3Y53_09130, partial [Bacillota bacterium]
MAGFYTSECHVGATCGRPHSNTSGVRKTGDHRSPLQNPNHTYIVANGRPKSNATGMRKRATTGRPYKTQTIHILWRMV